MTQTERIRLILPGAVKVDSSVIDFFARKAKKEAMRQGVPLTHELFEDIVDAYICHLLISTGTVQGAIASRSVGDVSVNFVTEKDRATTFLEDYNTLIIRAIGITRF